MITTDKEKLSYWENILISDLIQLSDEQTISYLMENDCPNIEHGADFEVKRIRTIIAQDSSAHWIILDISLLDFVWFVVVKSIRTEVDVKIFYIPDDFPEGNRQDLLDQGYNWLFEEPNDHDDIDITQLAFVSQIEEEGGTVFKTEGAEYGECCEGSERSFATVIEYTTESDIENPEMMILEFNNLTEWSDKEENEDEFGDIEVESRSGVNIDEESSFITLLQGCKVNLNDIKLLK